MIRSITAAALALVLSSAAWSADDSASGSASSPGSAASPAVAAAASGAAGAKSSVAPLSSLAVAGKPFVYTPYESDVVTGKAEAPVTIVEYASLSCPHCSHFFLHSLPELTTKYIDTGKVRLIYRNYPLNEPALKAAELVECAPADSRHAFVKVLFQSQLKWAYDVNYRDALKNIAVVGGIDQLQFEHCMGDKDVEKKVLKVAQEASVDYKVNSTPSFFINGEAYKGDHDPASLGKVIDAALAKAKK